MGIRQTTLSFEILRRVSSHLLKFLAITFAIKADSDHYVLLTLNLSTKDEKLHSQLRSIGIEKYWERLEIDEIRVSVERHFTGGERK